MRIVFSILATLIVGILIGVVLGRVYTTESYIDLVKVSSSFEQLNYYVQLRNIALNINSKNYDYAECNAELAATSAFDSLKVCTMDNKCRSQISAKLIELAPEVINNNDLPFERKLECINKEK
jgi:hypothetical protein